MTQRKHKPKRDQYMRKRGGPTFLNLYCATCNQHIALYQKDGPGALLRLYLDRIFEPPELAALHDAHKNTSLMCSGCGKLIATPMIYEPESRRALRLIPGALHKKKSDGAYPPHSEGS